MPPSHRPSLLPALTGRPRAAVAVLGAVVGLAWLLRLEWKVGLESTGPNAKNHPCDKPLGKWVLFGAVLLTAAVAVQVALTIWCVMRCSRLRARARTASQNKS
jgi:hypothetical protein